MTIACQLNVLGNRYWVNVVYCAVVGEGNIKLPPSTHVIPPTPKPHPTLTLSSHTTMICHALSPAFHPQPLSLTRGYLDRSPHYFLSDSCWSNNPYGRCPDNPEMAYSFWGDEMISAWGSARLLCQFIKSHRERDDCIRKTRGKEMKWS